MAALSPKNPVPLLLAGGVLLMLASRRSAARTGQAVSAPVPVRSAGVDYSHPPAVAEVLAQAVNRMTRGTPVKADAAAQGVTEAARLAVRAGDTYYGAGSIAWYAGNAEAAREAVREGDPYYTSAAGWSTPADVPVAVTVVQDGVISAPVYDVAEDADRWAGLIPADVLAGW